MQPCLPITRQRTVSEAPKLAVTEKRINNKNHFSTKVGPGPHSALTGHHSPPVSPIKYVPKFADIGNSPRGHAERACIVGLASPLLARAINQTQISRRVATAITMRCSTSRHNVSVDTGHAALSVSPRPRSTPACSAVQAGLRGRRLPATSQHQCRTACLARPRPANVCYSIALVLSVDSDD